MDAQVSYIRLIVGDNNSSRFTDAQIKQAAKITADQSATPSDLRLSGLLGFEKFPVEP